MEASQPQFEMPRLRALARHAVPRVVEGTVLPVLIFLVTLRLLGVAGAVAAGLLWSYTAIGRRLVVGKRVPGILVIGAATLTARSVLALATKSMFVYFLQPTLGTVLVSLAFLLSVPLGQPLAERLAHDFFPLPEAMTSNRHVRIFFRRITLLWAATQLANAAITIWLLLSQSTGTFVATKPFVSLGLTGGAIAVSVLWFRRSMARAGVLAPAVLTPAPAIA